MVATSTPNKALTKPANGDDVDFWDVPVNANSDVADSAFGATASINATAASGVVALVAAQYQPRFIIVTGVLTANVTYRFPALVRGQWYVTNGTTGAFTLTFSSNSGGTTYDIPQGKRVDLNCDTTGVRPGSAGSGANADITSLSALTTPLTVAQGGTGVATLTGIPKAAGTAAFVAATAGTDYAKPDTASTWTATQTLSGSSSTVAEILANAAEVTTSSATAATGTIAIYPSSQSILYFTTAAVANWIVNLTFSAGTTLNTALATGQTICITFGVTQGATAYYNTAVQIDGSTSGVITKWLGVAPTVGNVSGMDVYTYAVTKTGSGTFFVLASQAQFS